jgi:hypothetical protein
MKPFSMSVCGGKWRGYTGTKNEKEEMIKQIKIDTKDDNIEMAIKETGEEVTIEYWSKW